MRLLIAWVGRRHQEGYLCLDDVVIEKAFAKRLSRGRDGPTPSPKSARSTDCTSW